MDRQGILAVGGAAAGAHGPAGGPLVPPPDGSPPSDPRLAERDRFFEEERAFEGKGRHEAALRGQLRGLAFAREALDPEHEEILAGRRMILGDFRRGSRNRQD
jgi:hypothetical protein